MVNAENLGRAIAAYERTLLANNSPFDRYMRGDRSAMTAEQVSGMQRFERNGCIKCHNGPMFSDYKLFRFATFRGAMTEGEPSTSSWCNAVEGDRPASG